MTLETLTGGMPVKPSIASSLEDCDTTNYRRYNAKDDVCAGINREFLTHCGMTGGLYSDWSGSIMSRNVSIGRQDGEPTERIREQLNDESVSKFFLAIMERLEGGKGAAL
jgi:hypothetical protein